MSLTSCRCGKTLDPTWSFCPYCGKSCKTFSRLKAIFLLSLIFAVGYVISQFFLGEVPKDNLSSLRQKFDLAIQTKDYDHLLSLVSEISSKKISEITEDEKLVLVDSLTILSKVYPDNFDIQYNLGLASFLFGAFSKSFDIFSRLESEDKGKEELVILKILSLVGLNQLDSAKNLLRQSSLSDRSVKFIDAFLKLKEGKISEEEFRTTLALDPKNEYLILPFSQKIKTTKGFELVKWFYEHPIIGPKIKSHSIKNDVLILSLEDFPVNDMPDEARKKLILKIRDQIKSSGVSSVKILSNSVEVLEVKKDG